MDILHQFDVVRVINGDLNDCWNRLLQGVLQGLSERFLIFHYLPLAAE